MAGPGDEAPPTRREFELLRLRVEALEREVRGVRPPTAPAPATAVVRPPPAPLPPPSPARPKVAMETLLGERLAPRVGAVLVFLAALFFLGVGIQRGWIGPATQLAIAVLFAGALFGAGAWLTAKRGYGRYPQILEGTAATVLYATVFAAKEVPYYRDVVGLGEVAGAVLLAAVAAGTVALALWRDARVIAALGFLLAFVVAGLEADPLPDLTIGYVALLGAALAALVATKGWAREGLLGSLAVGAFFVWFGFTHQNGGLVSLLAVATAGAFFALALARPDPSNALERAGVAAVTLAWVVLATAAVAADTDREGQALLAWTPVAVGLAWLAARRRAGGAVVVAFGVGAVVLHALWPPLLLDEPGEALVRTLVWTATAFALAAIHRFRASSPGGLWLAGVAVALVAAVHGLADGGFAQSGTDDVLATAQAALVVAALVVLHGLRDAARVHLEPALTSGVVLGASALAVVGVVLAQVEGPTASVLLGLAGVAYLAAGFLLPHERALRYAGFALLGFVVVRVFVVDLEEADLVVRALVFLALGGILLGVGYVYARLARAKAAEPGR